MTDRVDLQSLLGLPTGHPRVVELERQRLFVRNHANSSLDLPSSPMTTTQRSSRWDAVYRQHRGHPSFRAHTWAMSREYGFSCSCSGDVEEWRTSLPDFRRMVTEHGGLRSSFENSIRHTEAIGRKARRRAEQRALIKAKALLHQYLSREQRWELRATQSFTVRASDGRIFRVTKASTSNVKLLENGVETKSLCVVAQGLRLPVYDLMLAQKFMLETDPEGFVKLAIVTDVAQVSQMRAFVRAQLTSLRQAG